MRGEAPVGSWGGEIKEEETDSSCVSAKPAASAQGTRRVEGACQRKG